MSPQDKTPEERIPLENIFPDVPRETLKQLKAFSELFWDWNHHINLTGEKTYDEFLIQQLGDCVSSSLIVCKNKCWIDVGTGGGLPGIVWGILFPEKKFFLVESQQKKMGFLSRAISHLQIKNIFLHGGRFKDLYPPKEFLGAAIVSRGTASPGEILKMASGTKFDFPNWVVFCSRKTSTEFLTQAKNFGMEAKEFNYPQKSPLGPGKEGILIILSRN